jgi:hypothetical protein
LTPRLKDEVVAWLSLRVGGGQALVEVVGRVVPLGLEATLRESPTQDVSARAARNQRLFGDGTLLSPAVLG